MRTWYCFLSILMGVLGGAMAADTLEGWSPEAQKLIPAESVVTVVLNNGVEQSGLLVEEREDAILLKMTRGSIQFDRLIQRSNIKSLNRRDPVDLLAQRLQATCSKLSESFSEDVARAIKPVLDEFLQREPDHAASVSLRAAQTVMVQQLKKVDRGLEQVDGEWLPPVQAAVHRFNKVDSRLEKLEQQYEGIEGEDFRGNPKARRYYESGVRTRLDIARRLPSTVTERMPILLREQRFDEAIAETQAFQTFWLSRILGQDDGQRSLSGEAAVQFREMDFAFFARLHQQILDSYTAAGFGKTPPQLSVKLPKGMAYVSGGYSLMGGADAAPASDTFPLHFVYTDPFFIDLTEVSNRDYRKFVEYIKKTGDSSMEHPDAPPLKEHTPEGWANPQLSGDDQPVVGVDWFDAYAYAKWKGKRLPTEAEWEKAARGLGTQPYPWGSDRPSSRIVSTRLGRLYTERLINRLRQASAPPPEKKGLLGGKEEPQTVPPISLPEATWDVSRRMPSQAYLYRVPRREDEPSPYGCFHLAGNAAEWVGDFYEATYYRQAPLRNPAGPEEGKGHVIRGGSYLDDDETSTTFVRRSSADNEQLRQGLSPSGNKPMVGFRCAKSL